jgi:hypothetical protein
MGGLPIMVVGGLTNLSKGIDSSLNAPANIRQGWVVSYIETFTR